MATVSFQVDYENEADFVAGSAAEIDLPPLAEQDEKSYILKLLQQTDKYFKENLEKMLSNTKSQRLVQILRKMCTNPDADKNIKLYAGREQALFDIILNYRHDPDCKEYISNLLDTSREFSRMGPNISREDNPTPQQSTAYSSLDPRLTTCGDKLVIVMVGLPARGKTYISRRLMRYLRFFHSVRVEIFNVGTYRRLLCGADVSHNFFSNDNAKAVNLRQQCAQLAMSDLKKFLVNSTTLGTVGVFDATNTTNKRRQWIISELLPVMESKSHIVFVESVCKDKDIITSNILQVKADSPDYVGKTKTDVVADFRKRIAHYENVYEPIMDDSLSYVRLVDAGRQVTMNNIKGYLPAKITQFLMCLHTVPRPIFLSLNGTSVYDEAGKIGGDSDLSAKGKSYAKALASFVESHVLSGLAAAWPLGTPPHTDEATGKLVNSKHESQIEVLYNPQHTRLWTSELKRCIQTVAHIPHHRHKDGWIQMRPKVWRALNQQYAGELDGMNVKEMEKAAPAELAQLRQKPLTYRYPRGESMLDLLTRLDPVVHEIERARDPILIVAHRSVLKLLYCYLTDQPRHKAPHVKIPRNHVIKLQPAAYSCTEEVFDVVKVASATSPSDRMGSRSVHHAPECEEWEPSPGQVARSTSFHATLNVLDGLDPTKMEFM